MKRGIGCLYLFLTFALGAVTSFGVHAFLDRFDTYYLNRNEALTDALFNARYHCKEAIHPRPVDCRHFDLTREDEDASGWYFQFTSADGRRTDWMWIGRRGEYDAMGQTDMDDPNQPPAAINENVPAEPIN